MEPVDLERIKQEAYSLLENKSLDKTLLEEKYSYLLGVSKTLFNMILKPNFQTSILEIMLERILKIQTEISTQEKESEKIGQELYNFYVKPKIE
jgi:hypothetical protein